MTLVDERSAQVDFAAARRTMIDGQLRVSGVNDPAILAAFAAIPREDFVPPARRALAYADRAVPLADGAVLAPALTHGQMLIAAQPTPDDRILVIGQPGDYLAALAAKLSGNVARAAPGDSVAAGAYSLILIDGAIEVVPATLTEALAEGGRVATGLIERGVARLALGRKVLGEITLTTLGEADFAALPAYAAKPGWSF